jgi:hypothetical protein
VFSPGYLPPAGQHFLHHAHLTRAFTGWLRLSILVPAKYHGGFDL